MAQGVKPPPGKYKVSLDTRESVLTVDDTGALVIGPFGIPIRWVWWEIGEDNWILLPSQFAAVTIQLLADGTAVGIENATGLGMTGYWEPV